MSLSLCPPALIYLIFCIIQIILDSVNGLYNTALVKTFIAIIITLLLNVLCKMGLGIVSWIIIFIPFIFMTVITSMLLYIFGMDVATGKQFTTTTYSQETPEYKEYKKEEEKKYITSPPFPPWMIPNKDGQNYVKEQNRYLSVSHDSEMAVQTPNAITIMPIQNLM